MHHLKALLPLVSLLGPGLVQAEYEVQTPPLDTDWTYEVGTDPWPDYPRPQLRREEWRSLNGIWSYQSAEGNDDIDSPPSGDLDSEVMIPSCIESGLSGVQEDIEVAHMWFRTTFEVPSDWEESGQSVLLNFEAVDWRATVFVNGEEVGTHEGGFWRFTFDVTDVVDFGGDNDLLVFVYDPTDSDDVSIPSGKQTLFGGHIWYRPCSGIWQPVWIESAPEDHITQLDVAAAANGTVTVNVHGSGSNGTEVEVSVIGEDGDAIATQTGTAGQQFQFAVDSPDLWSPDSPNLYNLTVTMGSDEISSYTGFRTIEVGEVDGVKRPMLNGEFVFQFGTLDQGYWPDGLYTPPNYEAMTYDIEVLKDIGFNMLRKHIKVEPDLYYYACDHLGIMVIQDMVSLAHQREPNEEQQANFERELEIMINQFKSYPSITTWVIYNEGWGQLPDGPEESLTRKVRELDPSRLIDAVSGWHDNGFGDFHDNHHYASPQCGTPYYSSANTPHDPDRIALQGEFGGIGHNVSIENLWNEQAKIDMIADTYEISENLEAYNYRSNVLLKELREQVELFACSGGVWTQTTDVEGEVNGLLTYDRRILRADAEQWRSDIRDLYEAAAERGGAPVSGSSSD